MLLTLIVFIPRRCSPGFNVRLTDDNNDDNDGVMQVQRYTSFHLQNVDAADIVDTPIGRNYRQGYQEINQEAGIRRTRPSRRDSMPHFVARSSFALHCCSSYLGRHQKLVT